MLVVAHFMLCHSKYTWFSDLSSFIALSGRVGRRILVVARYITPLPLPHKHLIESQFSSVLYTLLVTTNPASISPENHVILQAINYKWSVKHTDRLKEAISVPLHSTSDNWAIVSGTEEHPSASPGDGQYNSNSKFSLQLRTKLGLTQ